MEMCLWKPNSSERWCVIFSLPKDKAPSASALIPTCTQPLKLQPPSLQFIPNSPGGGGGGGGAPCLLVYVSACVCCACVLICFCLGSLCERCTSNPGIKGNRGEKHLSNSKCDCQYFARAPFFLPPGQSQVQSAALLPSIPPPPPLSPSPVSHIQSFSHLSGKKKKKGPRGVC